MTIDVNGRDYVVGCEDGQERRLTELAATVDAQVRQVAQDVGPLGETRLMLMGALVMADDIAVLRGEIDALKLEVADLKAAGGRAELTAIAALDAAATRIEGLVAA
ncbi:MAG TPA: cell division protein ZapA [Caulobacteraceae bacterium]